MHVETFRQRDRSLGCSPLIPGDTQRFLLIIEDNDDGSAGLVPSNTACRILPSDSPVKWRRESYKYVG